MDAGSEPMAAGPCAKIKVLGLSSMVSGPLCGQILGDLGADAIETLRAAGIIR